MKMLQPNPGALNHSIEYTVTGKNIKVFESER
jgi:hypothetical protein